MVTTILVITLSCLMLAPVSADSTIWRASIWHPPLVDAPLEPAPHPAIYEGIWSIGEEPVRVRPWGVERVGQRHSIVARTPDRTHTVIRLTSRSMFGDAMAILVSDGQIVWKTEKTWGGAEITQDGHFLILHGRGHFNIPNDNRAIYLGSGKKLYEGDDKRFTEPRKFRTPDRYGFLVNHYEHLRSRDQETPWFLECLGGDFTSRWNLPLPSQMGKVLDYFESRDSTIIIVTHSSQAGPGIGVWRIEMRAGKPHLGRETAVNLSGDGPGDLYPICQHTTSGDETIVVYYSIRGESSRPGSRGFRRNHFVAAVSARTCEVVWSRKIEASSGTKMSEGLAVDDQSGSVAVALRYSNEKPGYSKVFVISNSGESVREVLRSHWEPGPQSIYLTWLPGGLLVVEGRDEIRVLRP